LPDPYNVFQIYKNIQNILCHPNDIVKIEYSNFQIHVQISQVQNPNFNHFLF